MRVQISRYHGSGYLALDNQDRLCSNHFIAHLNGIKIIDFTDPTPKSLDGYISLQLHSGGLGNMRFKDISIRDLSKR